MTILLPISSSASDFKYKFIPFHGSASVQLNDIRDKLSALGLYPLDSLSEGHIPGFIADQIFTTLNFDKQIYVKLDIVPNDDRVRGTVIGMGRGFAFHSGVKVRRPFALYFNNIPHGTVLKILAKLELIPRRTVALNSFRNRLFWIENVEASEVICQPALNSIDILHPVIFTTQNTAYSQIIGKCVINAWQGMGDQLNEYKRFIATLFNDPTQLWNSAVQQFHQFTAFIANIHNELGELADLFSQLDFETKEQIVCALAGHLATDAALIGIGIGTARLTAAFKNAVTKLKSLASVLVIFKNAGTVPRTVLTADRIRNLLNGKIPKEASELASLLVKKSLFDAAMGVLTCEP